LELSLATVMLLSRKHDTLWEQHTALLEKHETLSEKHETLLKKHKTLSDTVHLREEQHKRMVNKEAVIVKLPGYANEKEKNGTFFSKPFYTHPGGYHMCIRVDPNGVGNGKCTHVSVFTKLLEGRYDNQLHWPFLGTVLVMA